MTETNPRIDRAIDALRTVSEDLADVALEQLAEAVRDGRTARPDTERRITRARAAVDKAIGLLQSLDDADGRHD